MSHGAWVMCHVSCVMCHVSLKTQDARRRTQDARRKTHDARRTTHDARRTTHDAKGITLIELVTVIVVLAVSIPILLTTWADIAWRSSRSEALADAAFYAQELMEEIKSKRYDENTSLPWSANLKPDTTTKGLDEINNETLTGMSNWDDVDDFNGYSDTTLAGGYTRSVTVDYLELSGSTWRTAVSPPTDFKRIRVAVSRAGILVKNVDLVAIVSAY